MSADVICAYEIPGESNYNAFNHKQPLDSVISYRIELSHFRPVQPIPASGPLAGASVT